MSECIVPSWNLNQPRQEVAGEERNVIRHEHNHPLPPAPPPAPANYVVPMSNYEVAELTWENGQVAMHGLTGILPSPAPPAVAANKVPTFGRTGDTLESIVHQATYYNNVDKTPNHHQQTQTIISRPDDGKKAGGNTQISPVLLKKKRLRSTTGSDHDQYRINFHGISSGSRNKSILHEDQVVASSGGAGADRERSACASASATFCRDATMMTWNSFESPRSVKTKTTDEDSACHDGSENRDEEDAETKEETYRSHPARRSRAALVHNQSERRRRDRINQKMKALQKLVPNASKTDKASLLDEVIQYLKQLQTQVHVMSTTTRAIPQIMINPLTMQQLQQQMSILARMGMGAGLGMGMGMLDMNTLARSASSSSIFQHGLIPTNTATTTNPIASMTPTFVPPHFVVPATAVQVSQPKSPADAAAAPAAPFSDPYSVYLAQQSMNMDFYNKMAALYRQQATNQATQTTSNSSQANFIRRE